MRKLTTIIFALFAVITVSAQVITDQELDDECDKLYPDAKWPDAALRLSHDIQLDKDGNMVFQKVIECKGSKSDIYIAANQWFTSSFDDAKQAITLSDKESGTLIAQPFVPEVANHEGGLNFYVVNLQPTIRVDIKDGKVRFTYTLQNYEVGVIVGAGTFGDFSSLDDFDSVEKWPIKECYPYIDKDKQKKTCSKAFVAAYAYSKLVMEKFEKAIQKATPSANDNW